MPDDTPMADEDRLIYQLTLHRDLVDWVIGQLAQADIASQRTTGNDPKGDILIIESRDASRVKEIISNIHDRFNVKTPRNSQSNLKESQTNLPHTEIKTTYLYGK